MAIKKYKITKKVKEIEEFINKSHQREIAMKIVLKNCKPYGGFDNVINNCGDSLVMSIITNSMIEYNKTIGVTTQN